MQRLVRHRRPMLAVILAALVALSSTLMMLITMGQQEETPVQQEKKHEQQEKKMKGDNQLIAKTTGNGKGHFGRRILNPINHKNLAVLNNEKKRTKATFTTAAAACIANSKANATFTTAPAPATSIV